MNAPLIAGIELGGTKIVCVLASGPDRVIDEARVPTTTPEETLPAIEAVLDGWRCDHGFDALGLGSFGPIDVDPASPTWGSITSTPKPGWSHVDVARRLRGRYEVPTAFDTDVSGAALAEGRWGGAQGLESFCYITVGTGVGVGVVSSGKPARGLGHVEAGHLRVGRVAGDDWAGACIYHGDCVEGLASGFAVEKRTGRRGETIGGDDPVWPLVAHALAGLCHNLVLTALPQRILIGGSVANHQPQILPMLRARLVESLAGYAQGERIADEIDTFVTSPALSDQAGPLGSIALGMEALA
ncbi:ROK family protein [Sphingomonas oryzagri]|uniref:fructokinase n=1 Tax=Sphingomonas oryzagri TaxID=3042314 RepID=A0ABT6N2Q0_9SPHN|nr:ROK family protein [Sphingomonas oryzagri]MDH7639563.1 ROK family protein [Sphingomonas oryzagri]